MAFTLDGIREHMTLMQPEVACIHLDELKQGQALHCIDSRRTAPTLGFPGGDAGFFMLILAALKQFAGRTPGVRLTEHLFEEYLNHFRHFYMHTDARSLDELGVRLVVDPRFERFARWEERPEKVLLFLKKEVPRDVEPALQKALLSEYLLRQEFIGCGHLHFMLQHPRAYGITREMLLVTLRSFFRTLWQGDERLELEMLEGELQPEALLRMERNKEADLCPNLPAPVPNFHGHQVLVFHPDARDFMVEEALHMVRGSAVPHALNLHSLDGLDTLMKELSERHLQRTLKYLGGRVPVFRVVPHDTYFSVEPYEG